MKHLEIRPIAEIPLEDVPGDAFQLIKAAVQNPDWDYRTISGIKAETGVQAEYVACVLDNTDVARRTVFVDEFRQAVYAASDKPQTIQELRAISEVGAEGHKVLEGPVDVVLTEALEDGVGPAEADLRRVDAL